MKTCYVFFVVKVSCNRTEEIIRILSAVKTLKCYIPIVPPKRCRWEKIQCDFLSAAKPKPWNTKCCSFESRLAKPFYPQCQTCIYPKPSYSISLHLHFAAQQVVDVKQQKIPGKHTSDTSGKAL